MVDPMSWKATAFVKEICENITPAEKLLLFVLADYHNTQQKAAWPSIPTLAKESLVSERQAYRILQRLERKNFISRGTVDGKKNSYHLVALDSTRDDILSGDSIVSGVGEQVPLTPCGSTPLTKTALTPDITPDISAHAIRKEPVIEQENGLILSPPSSEGKEIRFTPFKEMIFKFYRWKCNRDPMWDGSDAKQLSLLLASDPNLDLQTFRQWLKNYGDSTNISPGERPRFFLPKLSKYSISPLNSYGRSVDVEDETRRSAGERTDAALAKVFGRMPEQGVTAPRSRGNGSRGDGLEPISRILLERGN